MKKFILSVLAIIGLVAFAQAEQTVVSTLLIGDTGSVSATCVAPPGSGVLRVDSIEYAVDAGATSPTVDVMAGKKEYAITSATTASGTAFWLTNTGSVVAVGSFLLFQDVSTGTFYLTKVSSLNSVTTSVTVGPLDGATLPATATTDKLWLLETAVRFPAPYLCSATSKIGTIYLPQGVPSVFTLDGNTTSCKISVSGARIR